MTVPDLVQLPFDTDDGFGARARIGLIVLESDQTISSNMALFWHLLRLARFADEVDGLGQLFSRQLTAG